MLEESCKFSEHVILFKLQKKVMPVELYDGGLKSS